MTTITTTPTNLQPFPFLVKDKSSQRAISNLHRSLRQGKLKGPEHVALATARAMRHVVSAAKFNDLDQLVEIIKEAGREAQRGQIREQTVGNITRRILHLLREEAKALLLESEQEEINNPDSTSISTSKEANTSNNININQNSGFSTPGIGFSSPSSSRILSPPTSNVSTPGGSSFHHHQFSKRPSGPNRTETFQSGSFSIADLVAAGSQSNSNNNARTPGSGQSPSNVSGSNTPSNNNNHHGLSRDSSGFFDKFALSSISSQSENLDDDDEEEQIEVEEDEEDEEDGDGDFSEDDEEEEKSKSKNEKDQKTSFKHQLKPVLIQAIQELIDELETVRENIAKDARDHVHSGEVILTLGHSETVLAFLKAAAKDRKFTVIVAETAPSFSGHLTASALSSSSLGISVILVPDSSIFALLPRVSKVLLGAHSVLANGGLLSNPGSITCASAAKLNSTPVVILSGVYKICPDWTWIGGDLNHMIGTTSGGNSSQVIGFDDQIFNSNGDGGAYGDEDEEGSGLELVNPLWDYIPPNLVDVFITNVGEHPPSYVYRLIKENYAEQDLGEL